MMPIVEQHAETVAGGEDRAHAARDDDGVERNEDHGAQIPGFFTDHREDEVARMFGHEMQLRLRTVEEAFAEPLTATDRDFRLSQIPTRALRIGLRIEKHEQARALERFE